MAKKDKNIKKVKKNTAVAKKDRTKQRLQTLLYLLIIFASITALILFAVFVLDPIFIYRSADKDAEAGNYNAALEKYVELDGFLNSEKKIADIQEIILEKSVAEGDYEAAVLAAESSGELQTYIAERPEIFYHYAESKAENDPSVAKVYISYVLDYPGAKELYDEICLRNAQQLSEMGRYADVLLNFDAASSLDWLSTLAPAEVYDYAMDIAKYSYGRAAKVLETVADVNPAAKEKREAVESYLAYCGEKTCISDTAAGESVNATNVFDFFSMDGTEYLIAVSGDISSVYDVSNYAFAKDTDGSFFALSDDLETGTQYLYRFYMLENGILQEKMTITASDGTVKEYSRLWS